MKLAGKVVAITGAGSGIGRALALEVARAGAHVAGLDLDRARVEETASLVRAAHARCIAVQGDVSKPETAQAFHAAVIAEYGVVHVVINDAGIIQPFVPFSQLTLPQMERVMGVNWWGVVHVTHAFLPSLKTRKEAQLVNVSSMGGLCPVPGQGVYGASKAAVKLFSESLALELEGTSVGVTTVFPGGVKTNILANAPDISAEEKQRQQGQSRDYGVSAEEAAATIVNAIVKRKERLTVGMDAAVVDKLTRLSPKRVGHVMSLLMQHAGISVKET
ncbi:MAG: SDR family NAD(P)-dependent oxidoreductase [Sandaracinaceae bacterium]|nr:SDR family NAD(P)-dependent oxidoreductase [Sandaracinaceae bacterium]